MYGLEIRALFLEPLGKHVPRLRAGLERVGDAARAAA
jgi:hypothetical protein